MARDDDEFKFSDDDEYSLDDQMSNMSTKGEGSGKEGETDSMSSFEDNDFDNTELDGTQGDDPFSEDDPFTDGYPVSEPSFFNQHKIKIILGLSVTVLAVGVVMLKDTLFPTQAPPPKPVPVAKKPADKPDQTLPPSAPVVSVDDMKLLQKDVTKNAESIKAINENINKLNVSMQTSFKLITDRLEQNSSSIEVNDKKLQAIKEAMKPKHIVVKFNPKIRYVIDSCWNGRAWLKGSDNRLVNVSKGSMLNEYGRVVNVSGGEAANSSCVVVTQKGGEIRYGENDS